MAILVHDHCHLNILRIMIIPYKGLAPNWTLTSCQDIAHDYAKDLKMDKIQAGIITL